MANYTLSLTEDDDSSTNPYSPATAANPFALRQERDNSLLDVRQMLNLNAIFNLTTGFKANPLFVVRSGLPYTPIVGFDTQNDANDLNDRALVNGTVAGRNSMPQPAFSSLDSAPCQGLYSGARPTILTSSSTPLTSNLAGAKNLRFDSNGLSYFENGTQPVYPAGIPPFASGVTRIGGPRIIQFTVRLVGF